MDCLFCKIAAGEIPATKVYEDDDAVAFRDINPVAPVHILVVPKKHIQSLAAVEARDEALLGRLQLVISKIAKDAGIADEGYRVTTNIGENGGQTVKHLHYHIIGGRKLNIHVD